MNLYIVIYTDTKYRQYTVEMKILGIAYLARIADIIAIPFFFVAFLYLWRKPNKSVVEWILTGFLLIGFILDTVFTLDFLNIIGE